jgi:hypothetical protein
VIVLLEEKVMSIFRENPDVSITTFFSQPRIAPEYRVSFCHGKIVPPKNPLADNFTFSIFAID